MDFILVISTISNIVDCHPEDIYSHVSLFHLFAGGELNRHFCLDTNGPRYMCMAYSHTISVHFPVHSAGRVNTA